MFLKNMANTQNPENGHDRKEDDHADKIEPASQGLGDADVFHLIELFREGEDAVDKARQNGNGVKPPDVDALDHLGGEGAYLDPQQGAQEHAHGQGVKDEPINGILGNGAKTGGNR